MKKIVIVVFIVVAFSISLFALDYDYLESVTATGNGITTDNSQDWTDLFSVTIDVTDISYLLVTASINMRTDGNNIQAREANYNIYRSDEITDKSGVIKRQMKHNNETGVMSWGIGTLVHIFDVSSLTGNKTYTLEHSNKGGVTTARNVYSSARLTAVALSTEINHHELSNDVKRIDLDATTTTSSTFEAVSGLTTDAITLPINGDIFVIASINGKATENTSTVAEYKLEYSTNDGVDWADLGKPVKRSMINSWDDGIVSLTCMLQGQVADNDFKFRIAHKRVSGSGTVTTHNSNLCAVALAHSGGGYFPSFYREVGETGVDVDWGDSYESVFVEPITFNAAADIDGMGTSLFVSSQYLVSASNLDGIDRMRAGNQLYVSGASSASAEEYYRYIPDNSNFGAGGFIGLMTDLVSEGSYTIGMEHQIEHLSGTGGSGDEILTTSQIILTGFQTYDYGSDPPLPVTLSSFEAQYSSGTPTLYWTTHSESNNAYWNIYRSVSQNLGQSIQLNRNEIIAGAGTSTEPTDYIYTDTQGVVENFTYHYWIESIDYGGESEFYGPVSLFIPSGGSNQGTPTTPDSYGLQQNFPNPFNPSTVINFALEEDCEVELIIYNIKGKKVKTIFNDHIFADQINSVVWNGNDADGKQVSSGVYFYKLITENKEYQKKMLLVK